MNNRDMHSFGAQISLLCPLADKLCVNWSSLSLERQNPVELLEKPVELLENPVKLLQNPVELLENAEQFLKNLIENDLEILLFSWERNGVKWNGFQTIQNFLWSESWEIYFPIDIFRLCQFDLLNGIRGRRDIISATKLAY